MVGSASILAASAVRIASLNLCSDEYALLLARPGELVSVTMLVHDPMESILAPKARPIPANRGRIEDVIGQRPTLVLTMGGGGRNSAAIARALHIQVLSLPQPSSVEEVAANLRKVAGALGDPRRADPVIAQLARLRASARPKRDAIWVGGGGLSLTPGSLGAEWFALAGLRQRSLPGGRATLEELVRRPPVVLVTSNYRSGQMSQGQRWLSHPLLARLPSRRLSTDGRAWTCGGPLMIDEIERLRRANR